MSACLRTAAPPTILLPFTNVRDFCFRTTLQELQPKAEDKSNNNHFCRPWPCICWDGVQ